MDFGHVSDSVLAAMIGASATALATLVQLRISWRREMRERERGQPISRKTRRGPVLLVYALMIAAGVGGFALSQYLLTWREGDREALREEVQTKLTEINATALRLEQARLSERRQIETEIQRADAARRGEEGSAATVVVGPCRPEGAGGRRDCAESGALRVAVCARVPAAASVREVQLYTRPEDSKQSWQDSRVQPGQDAGEARFAAKSFERPDGDDARQICQGFANWSGEKSRFARIVVKYSL